MYNIGGDVLMQRVLFYVKNNLKKNIDLSKIGLIIRKLNEDEYSDILNGFKSLILVDKDLELAKEYYNFKNKKLKLTDKEKIKLFEEISKSENEKIIINIYNGFSKSVFDILTLSYIEKELNNFLIAEIDNEEFNKHFYENYIYDLIPKIINFSNYIASDDGEYEEYGSCKIYKYEGTKKDEDLINALLFMLISNKNLVHINENVLNKLEKMFKMKDKDFNFSFIMMIDNILEDNILVENSIINKVSFLERLLISKEEDKTNAFILKVGILCNKLFDITNEELSKRLKEIYNIRSMLVHGDGNKIIDSIDYYKKVFSPVIEKKSNKFETKLQILWTVDKILDLFLIRVLNKYLEDPNLCEYIKQN